MRFFFVEKLQCSIQVAPVFLALFGRHLLHVPEVGVSCSPHWVHVTGGERWKLQAVRDVHLNVDRLGIGQVSFNSRHHVEQEPGQHAEESHTPEQPGKRTKLVIDSVFPTRGSFRCSTSQGSCVNFVRRTPPKLN